MEALEVELHFSVERLLSGGDLDIPLARDIRVAEVVEEGSG